MEQQLEVGNEVAIKQEFEARRPAVTREMDALLKRPLGILTAEMASEFRGRCDEAIKAINDKLGPIISKAHETHRSLTALRLEMQAPYLEGKQAANQVLGSWQKKLDDDAAAERRRIAEEARRQAEEEARLRAEELARQAAEAEKSGDQAGAELYLEEAAKVEAAPVVPVVAAQPEPVRKVGNTSTSFVLKGTVKKCAVNLIVWLAKHPDRIDEFIDWHQASIDRALNRGVELPDVEVRREPVTRKVR